MEGGGWWAVGGISICRKERIICNSLPFKLSIRTKCMRIAFLECQTKLFIIICICICFFYLFFPLFIHYDEQLT